MPIITKSGLSKGVSGNITLNKSALKLLSIVSTNLDFNDDLNWSKVTMLFKSSVGNQSEVVEFNPAQDPCIGKFLVTLKARDSFDIQRIIISDFDGESLVIEETDLVGSDFNISLGVAAPTFTRVSPVTVSNIGSFIIVGQPSNGSYLPDASNYMYMTGAFGEVRIDMGSIKTTKKIGIGFGAFSGTPDSMEHLPFSITVQSSNDPGYNSYVAVKTFLYTSRSDFVANVQKDLVFDSDVSAQYLRISFSNIDTTYGGSVAITEISCYEAAI